jgi:hypothetical protein
MESEWKWLRIESNGGFWTWNLRVLITLLLLLMSHWSRNVATDGLGQVFFGDERCFIMSLLGLVVCSSWFFTTAVYFAPWTQTTHHTRAETVVYMLRRDRCSWASLPSREVSIPVPSRLNKPTTQVSAMQRPFLCRYNVQISISITKRTHHHYLIYWFLNDTVSNAQDIFRHNLTLHKDLEGSGPYVFECRYLKIFQDGLKGIEISW